MLQISSDILQLFSPMRGIFTMFTGRRVDGISKQIPFDITQYTDGVTDSSAVTIEGLLGLTHLCYHNYHFPFPSPK